MKKLYLADVEITKNKTFLIKAKSLDDAVRAAKTIRDELEEDNGAQPVTSVFLKNVKQVK